MHLFETMGIALPIGLSLSAILFVVYLLDINYFLRTGMVVFGGLFVRKRIGLLESSVLYARVLPFDADILITHMNNARVLREFDFGKMDLWSRTGLIKYYLMTCFMKSLFVMAQTIRYRRPLHMFMKYKIVTRLVHWEENILYHEQKIITTEDNITRCMSYNATFFPCKIDDFVVKHHPNISKPEAPEDLKVWINFNQVNRLKTKKKEPSKDSDEGESENWMSN